MDLIKNAVKDGILISGRNFKVKLVGFKEELKNTTHKGLLLSEKQEIFINKTYHVETRESTLIHEIIHQINLDYNIGLSEKNIERFEAGLYQVLKDNGLLK